MNTVLEVYAFIFGSLVGSFANVCIYRMPRDLSVVRPGSRCARCGAPVAWYDNIPLLSYVLLRGRCRKCGSGYGFCHLAVELLVGATAWWLYRTYGVTWVGTYLFILITSLIIVSAIDLEHRIIPDEISISGIWIGLALALLASWLGFEWFVTFKESLLGVFAGAGLLWGVGVVYEWLTGREGIGFGDVKLLALFGANTGIAGVLTSLFFGSLFGSVIGLIMIALQKKGARTPIPFGPFLCAGLLVYALGGQSWLLRFL